MRTAAETWRKLSIVFIVNSEQAASSRARALNNWYQTINCPVILRGILERAEFSFD